MLSLAADRLYKLLAKALSQDHGVSGLRIAALQHHTHASLDLLSIITSPRRMREVAVWMLFQVAVCMYLERRHGTGCVPRSATTCPVHCVLYCTLIIMLRIKNLHHCVPGTLCGRITQSNFK